MTPLTFTDFLHERWVKSGGSDGLYKDQWEGAFDRWLSDIDGAQLIEWGDQHSKQLREHLLKKAA